MCKNSYVNYDENNVFANILKKKIKVNVIYENEFVMAFHDVKPLAPIHIIVIPKFKCISFNDFIQNADQNFIYNYFISIYKIAKIFNLNDSGYRIVTNHGENAEQTIYHFHIHLLGKKKLGRFVE